MSFSFGAYIRLVLQKENYAAFFNSCKNNNINLYNVKKTDEGYLADVKCSDYRRALEIAQNTNSHISVKGRFGLLMKLILSKGRKAFYALALFLTLYYGVNSLYISEICINGNKIFPDSQILMCLKENGLQKGSLKLGFDPEIFREEFIKDFPGIAWAWVEIDGTKAIVSVREKVTKPEFFDYEFYCNIVASKDGVIKKAVSSSGSLLVSEGMFVKKGDLLISGVYDSTDIAPLRFINAGGIVHASTVYTIEDNFDGKYISYLAQNELKSFYSPKILNTKLYENKPKKNLTLNMEQYSKKIKLFGKNYLPLAFTNTKYCEIIRKEYQLSKDETIKLGIDELHKRLSLRIPDGAQVVNEKEDVTENPDGTFHIKLTFECLEDIAEKRAIVLE